jgi:glutamate synthase domain-containing protein 1
MCRIGAIKSKKPVHPSKALYLMRSQQKGHDNSGFAMVMQDLDGIFKPYKDFPLLSIAATDLGRQMVNDYMANHGWDGVFMWTPKINADPKLDIQAMPNYMFECYDYPKEYKNATKEEKEELLVNTRLALRDLLEENDEGYAYSFWPDVLTLKEIGNPKDIGTYFNIWDKQEKITARSIVVQVRQNTNYDIVRYAAHPFFLQGYTLCANGENTFYTKNKEMQKSLHKGYLGFESDSQCFLYTLHYVHHELKWPLKYYKHVITPLPNDQLMEREDKGALSSIRQSLMHLEINGPNTIIGVLPDKTMFSVCDSKKLRPVVIGQDGNMVVISSEVTGINDILPDRDQEQDIYTQEREMIVINNNLEVERWNQ